MDDELLSLEAELESLRPSGPSRNLAARIERELAPARRHLPGWGWIVVAAACAAGAAIVAMPPKSAAPAVQFKPVAAQDVLYSARDEGYVRLGDGTPAHRIRESHMDTITWEGPGGHASLRWSVPRDEVRVIPASFQ
jgi:hypothetical protein